MFFWRNLLQLGATWRNEPEMVRPDSGAWARQDVRDGASTLHHHILREKIQRLDWP